MGIQLPKKIIGLGKVERVDNSPVEREMIQPVVALDELKTDLRAGLFKDFFANNPAIRPKSLLVLLSDDTRPKTTPRIMIAATLDLLGELKQQGKLPEKVTLLTGTGTHKPMYEGHAGKNDLSKFFGPELYERLNREADKLNIQRDTAVQVEGLPIFQHDFNGKQSQLLDTGENFGNRESRLMVNALAAEHERILVAADVDLHPYRGASGSVHKFLAVGIAGAETIRETHAVDYLTDKTTGPGEVEKNAFAQVIVDGSEKIRRFIGEKFAQGNPGRTQQIGSVHFVTYHDEPLTLYSGPIEQKAWEEAVKEMVPLYTGEVHQQANLVVASVSAGKDQTLPQGMRVLDYLLRTNHPEQNPILDQAPEKRAAVMFTECIPNEDYNGGFATKASIKHMEHIETITAALLQKSQERLAAIKTKDALIQAQRELKQQALQQLTQYIEQVYDKDKIKGFGGGGQRVIRVLTVLQEFDEVFIGTPNTNVRARLAQMSPDLTDHIAPELKAQLQEDGVSVNLLGIRGMEVQGVEQSEGKSKVKDQKAVNQSAKAIVQEAAKMQSWKQDIQKPNTLVVPHMHVIAKYKAS